MCNNTEGSYECLCMDGYELDVDGRNCTGEGVEQQLDSSISLIMSVCSTQLYIRPDIDECYEGTDSCESNQICENTEGGFECSCIAPDSFLANGLCGSGQ